MKTSLFSSLLKIIKGIWHKLYALIIKGDNMIYKSKHTGAQIDEGIDNARVALVATDQNSDRIQILEAATENLSTQIGNQSVRIDNVSNTANNAKTTAESAQSTAQSASSTANNALTATGQNSERIDILEADNENNKTQIGALDIRLDNVEIKVNNIPQFSLEGTTLTITLPA